MRLAAIVMSSMLLTSAPAAAGGPVKLFAAGSLKAALSDVTTAFQEASNTAIASEFGASGLLREKIENGAEADVFASANMAHPQALAKAGRGGAVTRFAGNLLCALARPGLDVTTATLLDVMLRDDVKLGTSTPGADPSGDYAFALFAKAEQMKPGAQAALERKALTLTGGKDSARPPEGRNAYAWVVDGGQADIFLTYCTNVVLAKKRSARPAAHRSTGGACRGCRLRPHRPERCTEGSLSAG